MSGPSWPAAASGQGRTDRKGHASWVFLAAGLAVLGLFAVRVPEREQGPLVLGSWSAPRHLGEDYFELLQRLGFTHTLYWRSPKIDASQWRQDLDRAHRSGISLVFDSWQPAAIPEEWLQEVLLTACSHPAFAGVYAPDEPGYRFPLENEARRLSPERFERAFAAVQECSDAILFQVDASVAEESAIRRFLPFCSVFGLDIYPYKEGIDWRRYVASASRRARDLAAARPVWMVLQGHGRHDWYLYATRQLGMKLPLEEDPRPPLEALVEMAALARAQGADGLWWWSFELYDWREAEHRNFILQFREVHRRLAGRRSGKD